MPGQARRHRQGWRQLGTVIKAYEDLSDLMGKLASYAGLYYYANQADPERAKFYGDTNEALTRIGTDLIFFELELNQIDEAVIAAAVKAPKLAKYAPWIEDLRREKPYQLEERLERLFTEKGQTSRGAFSRLFNETMTTLRFPVAGEAEPLTLEPTLNLLSHPDGARRKAGAEALAKSSARTSACLRSSPTPSPRTRKSPTAGAASRTSPTAATWRTASKPPWWTPSSPPCAPPTRASRIAITP